MFNVFLMYFVSAFELAQRFAFLHEKTKKWSTYWLRKFDKYEWSKNVSDGIHMALKKIVLSWTISLQIFFIFQSKRFIFLFTSI